MTNEIGQDQTKQAGGIKSNLNGLLEYQLRSSATNQQSLTGAEGVIAPMLGLASETGSILDSQKRYLRDSIDSGANQKFLCEELGDLLWYIAAVASACDLKLDEIAENNLRRVFHLYGKNDSRQNEFRPAQPQVDGSSQQNENDTIAKCFTEYQQRASETSYLTLRGPQGPIAPMLGLASATGIVLNSHKNFLRDSSAFYADKEFLFEKLGDLLWFLSAVASASELELGVIAVENLKRSRYLYHAPSESLANLFAAFPVFDEKYLPTEQFPRILVVEFEEQSSSSGSRIAKQKVIAAIPNAFPNGPVKNKNGKEQGFKLNSPLGDQTTDNSRRPDGYRYHDAIHMAFMAVLGWSPTMRSLLKLKRKSNEDTDRDEDGARANYTEEGLVAMLARLSERRMGFVGENTIDGVVIEMATGAAQNLEVQSLPGWMWRRAINRGFLAMDSLTKHRGGFLKANLDKRELTYSKMRPDLTSESRP